jgi:hypothetical protein
LDDEDGTLLHAKRSQPEIVFARPEVEKMERVRVLGLPFLGEGVRITLKEVMFWGIPRRLLFFSGLGRGRGTYSGSPRPRGVKVNRRARDMFVLP